MKLTIDAEMQKLLERIVKLNIRAGAAVILETETGNIKAMTSVPEFSPDDISEDISAADAPLLNRALNPYSVGSVFKIVTAAACLENGFDAEKQYNCTGSITVGQNTFNCINEKGHGQVDMERALEVSCNCYFIHAGLEVGGDKILEMAEKLGFGKSTELAGGIVSAAGKLPSERNLASPAATANFAFGQGELMATPVQIACMVSAIANGGTYLEPKLVIGLTNAEGEVSQPAESGNSYRAVSDQTAEILKNYMISVVENGSGKSAKPENGGAGGKTATAQSGWYDDEGEIYHTWFAGFYPAEDPKYTIVLIKEDGNSGSKDCAPLFKQIVDGIDELSNS